MYAYRELLDPQQPGVVVVRRFLSTTSLMGVRSEISDTSRMPWQDRHETLTQNNRGISVVQQFDAFALKLSRGDKGRIFQYPYIRGVVYDIESLVSGMSAAVRSLRGWAADEVSIHRYDTQDVGISYHKDNMRFWGVVAIAALDGVADLSVQHQGIEHTFTTNPGDLVLMRAPGLIDSTEDLRPEHAVVNLQTPTRTSLMVRANSRPDEAIPGFSFANWVGK